MSDKVKNTIRGVLVAACLLIVQAPVLAQVYQWQGNTTSWNDPANWSVNGNPASAAPSAGDHVVFSSLADVVEVVIDADATAASLTVADNRPFFFSSARGAELTVSGHFNLNSASQINDNLKVQLTAQTGSGATFASAESNLSSILFADKAAYTRTQPFGENRASCGFFTIVPEVTNPTCNGDSDGIVAVEEPADGTGPYTYQWIGGPAAREWIGVGAGTYTVIVIDVGGGGVPCSQDIFVNEPGPLTLFAMNGVAPICFGDCNGSAAPVVIGGNGGYELTWSSGETGFMPEQLCASFTLEVEDLLGCQFTTDFDFPDAPEPVTVAGTVTDIFCAGDDDGSISAAVTGGDGSYTLNWTGPGGFTASVADINNLAPGTYSLTATDGSGCEGVGSFVVNEVEVLLASASVTDNLCPDGNEGEIALTVTGGTAPFTFAWTGPAGFTAGTQTISDLASGVYNLTLTDENDCTFTDSYTVNPPDDITVSAVIVDADCFGIPTGSIDANASGGTPPFSYAWTGPDGFTGVGGSITGLGPGLYELTVLDNNSCTYIESFEVTSPPEIELTVSAQPISCVGNGDGQITASATGGVAPYDFAWTGPGGYSSVDQNISGLEPGSYSLILTDDNGCTVSISETVTDAEPILTTGTVTNTTCASGSSGAIDIEVNGGVEPFVYAWTGPGGYASSDQNISGLAAGTYNVSVTDDEGCTGSAEFTVQSPDALTAVFDIEPATCFGGGDGSINTTAQGGTAPYSYFWIGPAGFSSSDQNIENLTAGTYTLLITDGNGCNGFLEAIVTAGTQINITRVITNVTCFDGSNGAINISVSGGTPAYTFDWTGPDGFTALTEDVSGIQAGTYSVTVTDVNGCEASRNYTVNQPAEITFNASVTNVICAGDDDGAVNISIASGAGPFTYSWSGPGGFTATTQSISGVLAGTYTLTATNSQGCQGISDFTVTEAPAIVLTADISGVTCFGDVDGSIDLTISGGEAPFSISWSGPNGFTSDQTELNNLEAGVYSVEVVDDFGCVGDADFTIASPGLLEVDITATNISCFGDGDGAAEAIVSGGTAPFIYAWTGPDSFVSNETGIDSLSAGSYTILITDASGCTAQATAQIIEPALLEVSTDATPPECLSNNGEITAVVTGGTAAVDYTFLWTNSGGNPVGTTQTISSLGPGTYTVTVTDDNGCQDAVTLQLLRDGINLSASVANVSCAGESDGIINVNPVSGTPPFTFSWTGPGGFTSDQQFLVDLAPGTYNLQVTDDTGCILNESYDVLEPAAISFAPDLTPESCAGATNGAIALNTTGGVPGYLYAWTGPEGFTSAAANISDLAAGTYDVTVTDVNGCEASVSLELEPDEEITLAFTAVDPLCFGDATGEISVSVTGGDAPFTYAWTGPDGFESSVEAPADLPEGEYTLLLTDASGCEATGMVDLTQPDPITADLTVLNATCLEANGSAQAIVAGGTGDLILTWTDSDGDVVATGPEMNNVVAGVYTLTVTDEAGCALVETVNISDADGAVSGTVTAASCSDASDGAIESSVEEGLPPFTYDWTGPAGFTSDQENISGIIAGLYNLAVTDDNGCVYTAEFEVTAPSQLVPIATIGGVSCAGDDGTASLTIDGGTPDYQIDWTGPAGFTAEGSDLTGLVIGTYIFTVTDAQSCFFEGSVEIESLPDIAVDATITDLICGGENDGAISISISGGSAPYTSAWTGPDGFESIFEDISELAAGAYNLTVTDALGCTADFDYMIDGPDSLELTVAVEAPDCGESNGSLAANISGGTVAGEYWISWADSEGNNLGGDNPLDNLAPGVYTLTAADDNGCSITENIVLANPGIAVTVDISDVSCTDDTDGAVTLDVVANNPPFTVSWTGPGGYTATGITIQDLVPGMYEYEIIASDGCSALGDAEVGNPLPITFNAQLAPTCFGSDNGSVELEIFNAVPEVDVQWTGPDGFIASGIELENLAPGTYDFTITDANGCTLSDAIEILENPELVVDIAVDEVTCAGGNDGELRVEVMGGTEPYLLAWTGPDGFVSEADTLENLAAGTYFLEIIDAAGCIVEAQAEVTAPDLLVADVTVSFADCQDPNAGTDIALLVSGGTEPYSVDWTGPEAFVSDEFTLSGLESGVYNYLITDAAGCELSGEVEATDLSLLAADVEVTDVSCNGLADGALNAEISGGNGPLTIAWSGPDGFTASEASVTDLPAGSYTLLLTDSTGCSFEAVFEVNEPEALSVVASEITDANCNVSNDGAATLELTGGTAPYAVSWSGPNGFTAEGTFQETLGPGAYEISAVDANGCEGAVDFEIDFILELNADAGADFSTCFSDLPATLSGLGEGGDEVWWTTIDGDTLSTTGEGLFSAEPGVYDLIFAAGNGICQAVDTVSLEILQGPEADAGSDLEVFAEEVFTLGGSPVSPTGVSYQWNPAADGNFDGTAANPSGFLTETTAFVVVVTDADGCTASDSVLVTVLPSVDISSGFTPNNDGVNDRWIIDNIELFPESIVSIFNRWGQLLYRQRSYNMGNAWDGTYEGNALPIGTYYYTIELNDARFPEPFTGPITIYR